MEEIDEGRCYRDEKVRDKRRLRLGINQI